MIFGEDAEADDVDDRELSLDMADFLNDGNAMPLHQMTEEAQVYAGEREECSNCRDEAEDDIAQESTFIENISYLPEPEQSLEIKPFDNTFDDMNLTQLGNLDKGHSFVLPRCQPRTRFGSEAASPAQADKR